MLSLDSEEDSEEVEPKEKAIETQATANIRETVLQAELPAALNLAEGTTDLVLPHPGGSKEQGNAAQNEVCKTQ